MGVGTIRKFLKAEYYYTGVQRILWDGEVYEIKITGEPRGSAQRSSTNRFGNLITGDGMEILTYYP